MSKTAYKVRISNGIARDSTYVLASRTVGIVFGILTSIVISRVLGPSNRGVYILLFTVNAMIINFGNFGIDFTNVYMLSKRKRSLNEVHSNSIIFSLFITTFVFFLYWITKDYLHSTILKGVNPLLTLVAIILVLPSLYGKYWMSMMSGLKKFVFLSKFQITMSIIGTIATLVVLLVFKLGIEGLVGWWVVSSIIVTIARIFIINRTDKIKVRFDKKLFKEILWFGFKGHVGNIAYHIYNRVDYFIVNFFTGATGVGYYSLSASLAEKTWFLPGPLAGTAQPRIGERSKQQSVKLVAKVSRHSILLALTVGIPLLIIVPWVIPLLYGKEYIPTVIPLLILIPGTVFVLVDQVISSYFTYQRGKPQIPSIVALVSLIIYIPFSIIMISRMGIIGAAITSTVTYMLASLIMLFLFIRDSGVSFVDVILPRLSDVRDYLNWISEMLGKVKKGLLVFSTKDR